LLDGYKMRQLRNMKGYTTNEVSKLTQISKSYIEELERGTKSNPSLGKIVSIAKVLGIKVDELIV